MCKDLIHTTESIERLSVKIIARTVVDNVYLFYGGAMTSWHQLFLFPLLISTLRLRSLVLYPATALRQEISVCIICSTSLTLSLIPKVLISTADCSLSSGQIKSAHTFRPNRGQYIRIDWLRKTFLVLHRLHANLWHTAWFDSNEFEGLRL
jgi:hypothetical protein